MPVTATVAADAKRWYAGAPARNTYERDADLSFEASPAAGMRHLTWQGRQAAKMDAEAR